MSSCAKLSGSWLELHSSAHFYSNARGTFHRDMGCVSAKGKTENSHSSFTNCVEKWLCLTFPELCLKI
jgi:hypothetical protein